MRNYLHAIGVILLASVAAGVAAAIPEFPQYSALLVPLAAALATAAGKVTQMARNAPSPQQAAEKASQVPPTMLILIVLACFGLNGCASFMHFSNPTLEDIATEFCNNYKAAHMAELQDQAKASGLNLNDVLHTFDVACFMRVKTAGPIGLGAVQLKAQGEELQK